MRTYVCTCPSRLRNVAAVSRLRALEFGMSRVRTLGAGRPAVVDVGARSRSPEDLGRLRIELKVLGLEEDGAGPSDGGGERGIFKHKVRDKRAGPSGLGDLEVTEYIARIRGGPFETRRERRICPPGND